MADENQNANKPLDVDNMSITSNGGIVKTDGGLATVDDSGNIGELLHGGEHFDDVTEAEGRCLNRQEKNRYPSLPRECSFHIVEVRGLKHPVPTASRRK